MNLLIALGVISGTVILYIGVMKIAAVAIAADERADSDFGYRGRYSRLDSWS